MKWRNWFRKKEPEDVGGIPWYIIVGGWGINVLESEGNIARGEIVKLNFTEGCRNQYGYNKQVVGSEGGYDWIWRHIADDWFKVVGKWPESPWNCQ